MGASAASKGWDEGWDEGWGVGGATDKGRVTFIIICGGGDACGSVTDAGRMAEVGGLGDPGAPDGLGIAEIGPDPPGFGGREIRIVSFFNLPCVVFSRALDVAAEGC